MQQWSQSHTQVPYVSIPVILDKCSHDNPLVIYFAIPCSCAFWVSSRQRKVYIKLLCDQEPSLEMFHYSVITFSIKLYLWAHPECEKYLVEIYNTAVFKITVNFQVKFHQREHCEIKVLRPVCESPWSVDSKTTITFNFLRHSSRVLAGERYFAIPARCSGRAKNHKKMCYFQPEFHLSKHYDNKFIRPDLESPWSVDFKTTITFKFTTHSSWVLACQRYFTIPSRCAEMAKNRQKMPDFTWNSTNLKVPKVQKKIYPHFLHTKRHSKNTSHLTKSNVCFFQHYLM